MNYILNEFCVDKSILFVTFTSSYNPINLIMFPVAEIVVYVATFT